jgi:hypothetical protein
MRRFFNLFFRVLVAACLVCLLPTTVDALSTGVPVLFTIDPATIRQRDKETTEVAVAVTLQTPSPSFFVCEIRSMDKNKINFTNIVFRKGDTQGKSQGLVRWKTVRTDCRVRVCAFSVDAPDQQLWFTVALKPKAVEEDADEAGGQQP